MFSTTKWFEGDWHYRSALTQDREVSLPYYADYGDSNVTFTKVFSCKKQENKRYFIYCEGNPLDTQLLVNDIPQTVKKDEKSGCLCWDITESVAQNNTATLSVADAPNGVRGGIHRNVWWRETALIYIANLPHITTHFTEKGVACMRTQLQIANMTDTPHSVTVSYRVVSSAGETVHAFEKKTIVCPAVDSTVSIEVDSLRVDAWTPEQPRVYRLEAEVKDGDTVVEKLSRVFAFRAVTFENDFCFVNGEMRFLKGLYYAGQDLLVPADNGWWRLCKHAQQMGCNALVTDAPPAFAQDTALQMGLVLLCNDQLPQNTQIYTPFVFADGTDSAAKQRETALAALAAFSRAEKDSHLAGFFLDCRMAVDGFGLRTSAVSLFAAAFGKKPIFEMEYTDKTVALCGNATAYTVYLNDHPMQELPTAGALTLFSLDTPFTELKIAAHFANGEDIVRRLRPTGRAVALRVTAHTYGRNLSKNRVDYIPITAEAVDSYGNRVTDFTDIVEFTPYTSGVLRADTDFTAETGISSDKFGNVVGGKSMTERVGGFRVNMQNGIAVVRLSAKSNSRFTAVSAECTLGKETAYIDY